MKNIAAIISGLFVLTACGGGSEGLAPAPTSPQPSPTTPGTPSLTPTIEGDGYAFYVSQNNVQGQSVSMSVAAAAGREFVSSQWQQLSGPAATVLASHTQVIGFDAVQAGEYRFSFNGRLDNGQTVDQTLSLTVNEDATPAANIRLDHSAVETSKVSLRVDGDIGKSIDTIVWTQTAGPQVDNLEQQDPYLFFDAPAVAKDEMIEFAAVLTYEDGTTALDTAYVLIDDVTVNANGYFPNPDISDQIVTPDMLPFNADSPYADALLSCVYDNDLGSSCPFSTLPLLGQTTNSPTIDDVMDRVLVSHPWMGERFREYLQRSVAAEDMLKLLRATTAVVISYDIRPSFYWSATGAIYLDAANFWATPEERDTLNDQPDYRAGFGSELQFNIPWRYVKDGRNYLSTGNYPVALRETKAFADTEASITWLLYHELAHANDAFPPSRWSVIGTATSPLRYANDNPPNSRAFAQTYPLSSQVLDELAQVSFSGATASEQQKSLLPDDVAAEFSPDDAPAYYSYSTQLEDYATLFERFMMAYRLGVDADVAVTGLRDDGLTISWGQRNRISEARIQLRVAAVVEQILPELAVRDIQVGLSQPLPLPQGESWFDAIDLQQRQAQPSQLLRTSIETANTAHLHLSSKLPVVRQGYPHRHRGKPAQ